MSVSPELGERRATDIPAGTIEYRESGNGQPVVFVHGVGVNGDLWRGVARTFIPEDQPDRLALIVHDFLTDRRPTATVA
jgi:pimeloyl-ACP methyl ester carboxylesterase